MSVILKVFKQNIFTVGGRALTTSGSLKHEVAVKASDPAGFDIDTWENAKPFKSIPGPKYSFLSVFSTSTRFSNVKVDLADIYKQLQKSYGDIVRLESFGKKVMVILFDPAHIEKIYRNESNWPLRPGIDCFLYYQNNTRPDIFGKMKSLAVLQGKEWRKLRTAVNPTMMNPKKSKMYVEPITVIADDFVKRIKKIRDEKLEMPSDFANELNKWSLESIAYISLDMRLGCLKDNLDPESKVQNLISTINVVFETSYCLELLTPFWKYMSTPKWRIFVKAMDTITDFTYNTVIEKAKVLRSSKDYGKSEPKSVFEELLRFQNENYAFIMAMDMLMAGVDTTATGAATVLALLATNPVKQEKLFEELKSFLPRKDSPITSEMLDDMKYLKATIKESMRHVKRMNPVVIANLRDTVKDMTLGGYQIPKGVSVIHVHGVICRDEKHFENPNQFIPERWLKSDPTSPAPTAHPFAYMPFGFGVRMCIGRRFAELEIETLVAKIIRNFKMSYHYGEMEWSIKLFNKPSKPLKFRLEDRKD